jgi:hypothetical protein
VSSGAADGGAGKGKPFAVVVPVVVVTPGTVVVVVLVTIGSGKCRCWAVWFAQAGLAAKPVAATTAQTPSRSLAALAVAAEVVFIVVLLLAGPLGPAPSVSSQLLFRP